MKGLLSIKPQVLRSYFYNNKAHVTEADSSLMNKPTKIFSRLAASLLTTLLP